MFVSPNSSVYVSNQVVYIQQALELNAATSHFYLRKDGQLVQATPALSANQGLGSLSVYQEGSSDNYQYNYWCSPVGGNVATAGNSGFTITQLMDVASVTNSTPVTILASNNYDGTASPLAIAPYWIWKLPSTSSNWVFVGSSNTLQAGEGFTMKGTSGTNTNTVNGVQNNPGAKQRYDFRGKPNDGTIAIPVLLDQLVLTGNPYPSAIDLAAFLTDATNSTGIAYYWEQDKTNASHYIANYLGGYGTYSPMGGSGNGVYTPATFYSYDGYGNPVAATGMGAVYERKFAPIGQGFMIRGSADGVVEMKNSYRKYVKEAKANLSEFERNANANKTPKKNATDTAIADAITPQIRFNALLNNQGVRQIVLAFAPNATDGMDHAMDAAPAGLNVVADVCFVVADNELVVNALPFDLDKKIPLEFSNNMQANFKISVNQILNLDQLDAVYLHDKIADTYLDIKENFFEVVLPAGVNKTQFEITFKTDRVLAVNELAKQDFVMYQNNETKNITINNPLQKELVSCAVYDIVGKLVFSKTKLGADLNYTFSSSGWSDGIYIVQLETKDKIRSTQKISIHN
ncbi:hypothetical protein LPBF_03855 [Flavobacterium crassostreae]|uniref:Secretion system C-terminal sorting domain-containing protein n=2 Tax=Flavobacterium crassostreae TaxID=1763534 RepID=A0A1B9E828_9FLAO|nr:hypothetical protein LPBF_03855 [Flavobacterium crassostreae]